MAKFFTLVLTAALLLLFLLQPCNFFSQIEVQGEQGMIDRAEGIDCSEKCSYRCSKSSREKICTRACMTCCYRCHCVPPGTSGNKEVCPCYANMKTHGGRPKCP